MNLLQVFFIISWVIIFILAIDIARKQKFNALHFFVFIFVWAWLLVFSFFPLILNHIWNIFWLQRWADVLVYTSIIFLLYFVLLLLKKVEENKEDFTSFVRELAISDSPKKIIKWKEVFVIAAYNEEKVIKDTINNLIENWYKNILVVNDGSKDNTLWLLSEIDWIILLSHLKNRWQWAALETWFEYLRRYWEVEYICSYDADWQHDLQDYKKFEEILDNNPNIEVVLWSRFIWENKTNFSLSKKILLKLAIVFTFFLSSIKLSDTHNWYRVFRKSFLNKFKITIDWMWHASEIIDIISSKKIKFKEVPVNIKYTDYSISKWQKASNAINIALRMIWNKFFK